MSKHREEILNDLRELEDRLRKLETAGRLNTIRASVYRDLYVDQLSISQAAFAYSDIVQTFEVEAHIRAMREMIKQMPELTARTTEVISAQVQEAEKTAAARLVAHDAQRTVVDSATEN